MKRLVVILLTILSITAVISGCQNEGTLSSMPESHGKCGEVIVVMPESTWKSQIGDTMQTFLRQEYLVLPQYESTLKVIHIKPRAYTDIFQRSRNIILCDIRSDIEKTTFSIEHNKTAAPQTYITIKANSDTAFLNAWYKVEQTVVDTIVKYELNRFLKGFKKTQNVYLMDTLRNKYNIDMVMPTAGFNLDVCKDNFAWISKETSETSQGFLIWKYPYNGPKDFNIQYLINKMDSVLMQNVPGPVDGSYMAVEKRIPPLKDEFNRNGNYVCQLRGLWETEGAFMGGPFVSQTQVDTVKNEITTVFAYVYGGKKAKKILLWQLESLLTTFNIHYDAKN